MFTDCRTLPVTYTFSDPSIFKLEEDHSKSKEEIILLIESDSSHGWKSQNLFLW